MKRQYRFVKPSAPVRRAKLDNLATVPGNLLPYKASWQEAANRPPTEAILIVLPAINTIQKRTLLTVAKLLAQEGHQVSMMAGKRVSVGSSENR